MKHTLATLLIALTGAALRAQDAATSNVDLGPKPTETPELAKQTPPEVPELSQLDQAFKQSSLGKAADEYRTRVEWRRLQNEAINDPAIIVAKKSADAARTDLEKRERLRDYYNIYYGRMRARASSAELKNAIDTFKAEHLKLLDQPRVRPSDDAPIPVSTPKKGKQHHHSQ
jgi:hypothetical protein